MISAEKKAFCRAIVDNDVDTIRKLAKIDPSLPGNTWSSGDLHLAAGEGNTEACAVLVDLGVDINRDCNGTALEDASSKGKVETVKWFLEHGALVDGLPTGVSTPLVSACIEGHLEVVRVLLDAGAEINREHLRLPQTALDFAVLYQVENTGQDAVAAFLRERGGIRPYWEKHDWSGVPGQRTIECMERAVGCNVNPLVACEMELPSGGHLVVRKVRIGTKFDFQILFTVGLYPSGIELALCLPSEWPLNQSSLKESRYAWPLEMLKRVSAFHAQRLELGHGYVLERDHPVFSGLPIPEGIHQWVVVRNQVLESERGGEITLPSTFLLVPNRGKKALKPGAETLAFADKQVPAKWKALALSL